MTVQHISLKDFEIQNKIKKELKVKVREWTEQYCDAIEQNYKEYHIRTLNGNLSGDYPEYAQKQLDEIKNGTAKLMKFRIQEGRKYYTGEVYMAASWNKPAKHVRFDMRIIKERTLMHTPSFVTWAGGYLYLR